MSELEHLRELRLEVVRYAAELRTFSQTREGIEAAMRLEQITATLVHPEERAA